MQKLPIRYFDTHTHGDLMSHFTNDTDTLQQMLSQSVPQMFSSAMTIILGVHRHAGDECMADAVRTARRVRHAQGGKEAGRSVREVLPRAAEVARQGQRLYRGR